jgi:hypothetical protein
MVTESIGSVCVLDVDLFQQQQGSEGLRSSILDGYGWRKMESPTLGKDYCYGLVLIVHKDIRRKN